VNRALNAAGFVWSLPGTVIGLALGATMATRPAMHDGAMVFTANRGFGALHRRLGFSAITFGRVILANRPLDETIMRHELAHVRQWDAFGPLTFVAYPLASIRGYRRNPFEVAARKSAGEQ